MRKAFNHPHGHDDICLPLELKKIKQEIISSSLFKCRGIPAKAKWLHYHINTNVRKASLLTPSPMKCAQFRPKRQRSESKVMNYVTLTASGLTRV